MVLVYYWDEKIRYKWNLILSRQFYQGFCFILPLPWLRNSIAHGHDLERWARTASLSCVPRTSHHKNLEHISMLVRKLTHAPINEILSLFLKTCSDNSWLETSTLLPVTSLLVALRTVKLQEWKLESKYFIQNYLFQGP